MALVELFDDQPQHSQEFVELALCQDPPQPEEGFLVETRRDKVFLGNIAISRTTSTPETILDETPIVVFPGYCGIEAGYGKFRDAMAATGHGRNRT
jgi:hypothetical protein